MANKRGGRGRGRGADGVSSKRKANTPIGGQYKDARRNITGEEVYNVYGDEQEEDEEERTQVQH